MNRRMRAVPVFLAYMAINGFFSRMMGVIFSVFLILRLGLGPFQLVLLGTVLEGSYLLFETPTGVVADTISRRTSIVIGLAGGGVGFLLLALSHSFWMAAASQLIWGVFATFESGADVAWLTDEVGEEAARPLYLRGDQFWHAAALAGIVAGVALATVNLALPILVAGVGQLLLAAALWIVMPEQGFERRARRDGEQLHQSLIATFREGVKAMRSHPTLVLILSTAALHGASTEGFDRLSDLHILRDIGLPAIGQLSQAAVVRDPGWRCARARVRRVDRGATPGDARRSCSRRADPGSDRRLPCPQHHRVRADRAVLGGTRGDVGGRCPAERARSGVPGMDQPGARCEDPRDDQLGRRSGRRGGADGGGSGARCNRGRHRGPHRTHRIRRATASDAPAVPSRHPQGNGGHARAGRDGSRARARGRAGLTAGYREAADVGRRTPLMRAMRELADVHASLPQDRPLSLDEAIELQRRRFSRRQVLRGAGVLGAGLAVAQPLAALARPRRRGAHEPRVVVVGAGLAGVSCAYKLQQHGIRADLYESRDRVGGRCWSARTFADGQVAEHGGEFVDTRHVQLRRLVAALGLHLDDLFPAYEDEGDVTGLLVLEGEQRDRHEVHAHFDVVIRRLMRDAKRVGPYRWGQAGPAAKAFDQMTMREWMDDNVPGGSGSLLGLSMDVGLTGFWGIDPEDTSAITLARHVHHAVSRRTGRRALSHPRRERSGAEHAGGPASRGRAPSGVAAGRRWRKLATEPTSSTSEAWRRQWSPTTSCSVCRSPRFATSTSRKRDSTRSGWSDRELGMGTNAKVLLQFEDRFPTFGWNGLFEPDVPKTDSWDSALAEPGSGGITDHLHREGRPERAIRWITASCAGPVKAWSTMRSTFLDTYLPGIRDVVQRALVAGLVGGRPVGEGLLRGVPARAMDGLLRLHGAPAGNVHFAGEHTSTYSQGYFNGGVETGLRAAAR